MKKIFSFLILILVIFAFTACTPPDGDSSSVNSSSVIDSSGSFPEDSVSVTALMQSVEIEDIKLNAYDFTTCFNITENEENIPVVQEYLDLSKLENTAGTYEVFCLYKGVSAKIEVIVFHNEYEVLLAVEQISVSKAQALTYDYSSLFTLTLNGSRVELTQDMIQTDISNIPGTYSYTVTYGDKTQTLIIVITNEHEITVAVSYEICEIAISKLQTFDYTTLFSLFVDGVAQKVTNDLIDLTALNGAKVGDEVEVVFNYSQDASSVTKKAKVLVVQDDELVINAKNIQTYPNSGAIDLTSLFTITKGDKQIEVTPDMVTGTIDYSVQGENLITLTYEGQTATAVVEVVIGVVISYKTSDTVVIKKGTNQESYPFEKDFVVIINGVRFTVISEYVDSSNVDFSTAGSYKAKLKIPYNEKTLSLTGVRFDYYESEITYLVVENEYTARVNAQTLTLPKGTTSYNLFKNLSVTINGRNQTLTDNPAYVDKISCYAKVVSNPIDWNNVGIQEVVIEVYVNGVDAQPITLSYNLIIASDVEVTAQNKVIFTGDTLFATQLFTITSSGEEIEVTFDMITGKIDSFTPGVYNVTVNYEGIKKTARVVVLSNEMKGSYKTNLYSIMPNNYYDSEYGDTAPTKTRVGAMSVSPSGEIIIKGAKAQIIDALDEKTLVIDYKGNIHTLYYDNGIITIIPENEIKLTYYEEKRPYVYFNENVWQITRKTIINSTETYVLDDDIVAYSLDVFTIKNKATGETLVYVLKTHLASRMSSDTIYVHSWGYGEFAEGFVGKKGESSSLTFEGVIYPFTLLDGETGKMPKADEDKRLYAGMTFTGTVDGKTATLSANNYQAFTLTVEGTKIFTAGTFEISSMKNGGVNYETGEIFLYAVDTRDDIFYSYKFVVDTKTKTFEYIPKDRLLGYYEDENSYIFLDGYGSGFVNFNKKSYYETQFNYSKLNNIITVNYKDTLPDFEYGKTAQFSLDAFGNVLTAHSGVGYTIGGAYKNRYIQSGIIVNVDIETIGAASDTVAKAELYRAIEIVTANGSASADASGVGSYINTTKVRFNTPGFYQLTISAEVYGERVTAYYSIQVLQATCEGHPLVQTYGAGVIYPENALIIDKYGRLTLSVNQEVYVGAIKMAEDNSFTSELYGDNGVVEVEGKYIATGLIQIRASGAVGYLDYYTTGKNYIVGKDTTILRAFELSNQTVYVLATSETSATGEVVSVQRVNGDKTLANGAILKITHSKGNTFVKVVNLQDAKKGLEFSDAYRGTFVCEGEPTLTLDGFGFATLGSSSGTYVINGGYKVTLFINNVPSVYQIDLQTGVYQKLNVAFDASLVAGKTFTAEYNFFCNESMYTAVTTFAFTADGKVKVTSTSSSHDGGEDKCYVDVYSPVFCAGGSAVGTFGVNGTKVTVTVGGYTFVFNITNVVRVNELVCENNGGIADDAHGYFAIGTKFANQ